MTTADIATQVVETKSGPIQTATTVSPEAVIEIARALAVEMHPHKEATLDITLDSSLELDVGLDSLGRVELLMRLEKAFGVHLPEQMLANAESPRDLVREVSNASGRTAVVELPAEVRVAGLDKTSALPLGAKTLVEVLDWHVLTHPDRPHMIFLDEDNVENELTYGQLRQRAREVAHGLRERGVAPGDTVAIMLPTGLDFFYAFFGILIAGATPVPIYPPARLSQLEDHLRRQAGILANARVKVLATVPQAKQLARFLKAKVDELEHVETVTDLRQEFPEDTAWPIPKANDLAFLQYTSGSTGNPKGVMLSHANLVANVRAMGLALKADSTDVFVSWLPLYHDMGLIGAWMGSLYHAVKLVVMSPLTFLARPDRWLWAVHRYGGTISAAPNFAYELCQKRIEDADIEGLDLSTWRVAANGAEPVIPDTMRAFANRFESYGFKQDSMKPVYGLAESSVGLAFPPFGREPIIDRVKRRAFTSGGEAVPAREDDEGALEFVACGWPLPGHEFRVVDDANRELPDRREGRLQFRGPSSTMGYFRNAEATAKLFFDDWLDSGDYAYLHAGDVYLTGRAKDIIIKAGRNIYPQEIERAVGDVEGVRTGCVAVFGSLNEENGTERLVVMAETRTRDDSERLEIRRRIEEVTSSILGAPPDDVHLVDAQAVLKTSSGKIRRDANRIAYETGADSPARRAIWMQIVRLGLSTVIPETRRLLRNLAEYVFAGWWWLHVGIAAGIAWPLITLVPGRRFGHGLVRLAGKYILAMTFTTPRVKGLENLQAGAKVVVPNHSSFIDPLLLWASLPGELAFAAKAELKETWLTRGFVKHVGALFVDRFDTQRSVEDSARLFDALKSGRTVAVFPEGTFGRMPGLLPFRMGAFMVAAEARVPVIPVAVRGARGTLRDGSWFPRRMQISVTVLPAINADGSDWSAAIRLRDQVRAAMLDGTGEPDLAHETSKYENLKHKKE
ncbi:MAG: AMP-binding protein [Alphaproteobacteria bacterium]|jgi:acyl carrier protein|nr:AMP-binding protein [Alphaproteobacteria bacterium]MBT4082654.1 AMP-binding protein [Alphaproteobacteria bacterium]MBT4545916.1 AMP-binding protein [Alphaproteobacteria bacterium]MBT6388046.1 AMP-binding protein [Alphaproteobacteria bacterium]MBT7746421.1 AMP-binding protein [Alphaproteobacteria bacterium]